VNRLGGAAMPIRERAGKWHYRFYVQGREFAGSTDLDATARNKTAALRREAEVRRLILEGKQNVLKLEIKPFTEAAEQFLNWADGHYAEHPNRPYPYQLHEPDGVFRSHSAHINHARSH
jgi:hypothetical protein